MSQRWNPYFVCFAAAHGRTPEQQDEIDRGGTGKLEFIVWMSCRWQEYRKLRGLRRDDPPDHADFARWLPTRTKELRSAA